MDDKTKLASCQEESQAIQFANDLYLKHNEHSPAATAEYLRRLERLEEVRKDMKELAKAITVQNRSLSGISEAERSADGERTAPEVKA